MTRSYLNFLLTPFKTGLLSFYKKNEGYLQGQIGNPEGDDKPNKSYYDPRKWVRRLA